MRPARNRHRLRPPSVHLLLTSILHSTRPCEQLSMLERLSRQPRDPRDLPLVPSARQRVRWGRDGYG
ncbi:hypothetical protein GY45DRAFT_88686 [Cubamyces sp. BRFM 1775]|nr:hypothetical protein GY45DRAFT_88686 [Cubamyces sp. BRFM 1775]